MTEYFAFRWLASTTIIKGVYFVGMLLLTITAIALIVIGIVEFSSTDQVNLPAMFQQPEVTIFAGVVLLIGGNLVWRLMCEAWILLFSVHEVLASIDRRLSERIV